MSQEALDLLERLTIDAPKRQKRRTELLKPAETESTEGWFMCVRDCFNNSLDIRRTERTVNGRKVLVWTQGSAFSFAVGDTLYDAADACKAPATAPSVLVQVREALPAVPASENSGRFSGSVTFDIHGMHGRIGHTLTQDAFVRFLIAGPSGELAGKLTSTEAHTSA